MANYWIKLYHEILHDPKMIRLPDRLFALAIKLFLLAGETNNGGYLPTTDDIAVVLRMEEEYLESAMIELSYVGILSSDSGRWYVTHFIQRQKPADGAERVKRYRERLQKTDYYPEEDRNEVCNDSLQVRYTDKIRIESDTDKEKKLRVSGGIFALYQDTFGLFPAGVLIDELIAYEKKLPIEKLRRAFEITAEQNKRSWAYTKRIIDRWILEGYDGGTWDKPTSKPKPQDEGYTNVTQQRLAKQNTVK